MFHEQKQKFETALKELLQEQQQKISQLEETVNLKRTFTMENFTKQKAMNRDIPWNSPVMYTLYKFCIGIWPNGYGSCRNEAMVVLLYAMPGKYDHLLVWPAKASFTLELVNQRGGENALAEVEGEWKRPSRQFSIASFERKIINSWCAFIEQHEVDDFLYQDTLQFRICSVFSSTT